MTRSSCPGVVVGVLVLLAGCTSTSADGGGVLVVEGYGAEYQQLFEDTIAEPFTAATGIEIRYAAGGSASEQYAAVRASAGDPGFDVAVMTSLELYQGSRDGLLAEVTEEQVPNLRNVPGKLRDNTYGVGAIQDVQQVVLMYRKDLFPQPPTSWDVMWEPRYRGGTLIFNPGNIMGVYAMLSAAELDGGGIDNTAPGFARIADLARYALATPQASAEAVPFMTKKTATVFPYLDGRAAIYARTTDYDYAVPKEGTYASLGSLGIPVGAANKDAAYRFIDYWLSPEVQRKWALAYHVGPAVTGLEFPPDFSSRHITTAEQLEKTKIADAATVVENRTSWGEQWAEAVR
ncbi:extracellular solute-binding protein [Actinophytocola algeriensis]|uniref:Spermidine/putrescine-binding protein n=1 Tax=Actinophytocola algeriensis TaxID=1768010 RepID=A0A7W7VHS2_9PSEU|nr:extracellular solute-binding protein [Actinophytocola algeriensis]MBB4910514.1 spermidine/putrescine-binding protein [Actinophytocola algeriensis]MBE1480497.1 spermidine/putrescine-binding protein [Actinophytocola algeriensis]